MKSMIFSGPMVRAYLDGRKTMTRRPQGLERINENPDEWSQAIELSDGTWSFWYPGNVTEDFAHTAYPSGGFKPRYLPGETVYVKETWCVHKLYDEIKPSDLPDKEYLQNGITYMADVFNGEKSTWMGKTRSPLFLTEKLARIKTPILTVGVERLQDITGGDAENEIGGWDKSHNFDPISEFIELWDTLYADKPELQWDKNPWVWVYGFEGEG